MRFQHCFELSFDLAEPAFDLLVCAAITTTAQEAWLRAVQNELFGHCLCWLPPIILKLMNTVCVYSELRELRKVVS